MVALITTVRRVVLSRVVCAKATGVGSGVGFGTGDGLGVGSRLGDGVVPLVVPVVLPVPASVFPALPLLPEAPGVTAPEAVFTRMAVPPSSADGTAAVRLPDPSVVYTWPV